MLRTTLESGKFNQYHILTTVGFRVGDRAHHVSAGSDGDKGTYVIRDVCTSSGALRSNCEEGN